MVSLVSLSTFCDGKLVCRGSGVKVEHYIIAHYSAIALDPVEVDLNMYFNKVYVEKEYSLQNDEPMLHIHRRLKLLKRWCCRTFYKHFVNYFNSKDFGEPNVAVCATFVLLGIQEVLQPTDEIDFQRILQSMGSDVCVKFPRQGMRIASFNGEVGRPYLQLDGIISHTFECDEFFNVDLGIGSAAIITSYPWRQRKTITLLGIVIFQDTIPFPFQVFPVCISFKHLLSVECLISSCGIMSAILRRGLTPFRSPLSDFSCTVTCGCQVGSGTLISNNEILTCAHVVKDYRQQTITAYFGMRPIPAEVLFYPNTPHSMDVAILVVTPPPVPIVEMKFTPAVIGSQVFAVGTPYIRGWLNIYPWISSGQIVQHYRQYMMASCPVHDGFSGGGLYDRKGYLIGIICGKAFPLTKSDTSPRLTQIVPISLIRDIIERYVTPTSSLKDRNTQRSSTTVTEAPQNNEHNQRGPKQEKTSPNTFVSEPSQIKEENLDNGGNEGPSSISGPVTFETTNAEEDTSPKHPPKQEE